MRSKTQRPRVVTAASSGATEAKWLVLFHQIPPAPAYLRVKIGRRLARVGAIALKNSVYVLPRSEGALEDLHWVVQEILDGGGDVTLCEARFVEGLSDVEIEHRFQEVRGEDYAAITKEARGLAKGRRKVVRVGDAARSKLEADVARLERRVEEVAAIDFFHAPGREAAVSLVRSLRDRLVNAQKAAGPSKETDSTERYVDKVWVTRTGIHVDRIASAWLIRRFIDPNASFKFVAAKGYEPEKDEIRFDMFDAEFTHEGDRCTFEVLVERLSIREAGVRALAEIVHDIDLKDSKFEHPETPGVAAVVAGLCALHREDELRLQSGSAVFDQLLRFFARRRP